MQGPRRELKRPAFLLRKIPPRMNRRHLPITLCLAALCAVGATGCAPRADLQPAPAANEVAGQEEAARSVVDDVRVVAQTASWPGDAPVKNEVTPVQVTIENGSGNPVRLRYNEFALVGPDGQRYSALPPFEVGGSVEEPVVVDGYDPIASPAFAYDGYSVAPYYGSVYTGLTPYAGTFGYDPYYYDAYDTYWADVDIELPTDEMLNRALPEGVLESGGSVEGFVYFEKVTEDVPRVTFRADLVNANTGDVFGEIRVPFTVE